MDQFIGYPEILTMTGLSVDGLRRRMRLNQFPKPTHRRGAKRYWLRSEVDAALARMALPAPMTPEPAQTD